MARMIADLEMTDAPEAPEALAAAIAACEQRASDHQEIGLDEIRALERKTQPLRRGPHYQLAQRVRKLAMRLGHADTAQWEQLKQTPMPTFTMAERSYIGHFASQHHAPVELKVVFDHLFLTTNHRVSLGAYDLVKITHRFNREGRLDLIDARLKQTLRLYEAPLTSEPVEDAIFHLVQVFAFKDKLPELAWEESRCEYFIRLRQIAAMFYDLGLTHEEQQYRHLIQFGHRLAQEIHRDIQAGTLRDARVTRLPFYPIHQLRDDEAAAYIISRAAALQPRVQFDTHLRGGHLGDLRLRYAAH